LQLVQAAASLPLLCGRLDLPFAQEEITIQSVYKQGYQLMLPVTVNGE
jgi:hypothetical protein